MRRVWLLVGSLTLVVLVILGNRIWHIRFLYIRSEARTDLVQIMKVANEEKGWSASDLQLRTIVCTHDKKCVFVFNYQYRGSLVKTDAHLVEAWVESGFVRFENI